MNSSIGRSTLDARRTGRSITNAAIDAPAVNVVNSLLNEAVSLGASDIHIAGHDDAVTVRYRIDGVLQSAESTSGTLTDGVRLSRLVGGRFATVSARLKVLAGLNAAERRRPQDGRFTADLDDDSFDVRFSSMPTIGGESLVLRLFPRTGDRHALCELGMSHELRRRLEAAIERRSGFVLISGPTGSGKTTTLHASLSHINRGDRKIITIEDPVEYRLPGIEQIQTNEPAGMTFESLLRRVLRQDPNVIMVGEIRDRATAELSVRAALTGHLVLATIHSRSATDVRARLVDLGVEASLLEMLRPMLIAQRLIRTVCPGCGGIPAASGGRCERCHGTGLRGRTGIFGMVENNEEVISIAEDGRLKIDAGITTEEEAVCAANT